MSFSGREIFLILRARDEASRTLHRVSRSMSKMDLDAAHASNMAIKGHQDNLFDLQRRLGEVNTAYSNTAATAKTLYQQRMDQVTQGMTELRRRTDDVHRAYQYTALEASKLRAANKISADQYAKQMLAARKLRAQNLQDIQKERYTIEDAQHGIQREYHKTMQDARRLHLQQQEAIRGEINSSKDAIRMHRQRIADINEQNRLAREHGHQLMRNGTSALYAGASLATIGAIGVYAYTRTTKAAMDYSQAASLTLTQIDDTSVKLKDIEEIGLDVAKSIPAAFEQIQPALYDIFSSIDVNVQEARILLKQFAQDAVAGQTDMETATRANLAVMNAFKVKTKDAYKVSDFMFRLVQKGVGTYQDFARAIGKAIPSTKRAGQSYHTLGAMMAFLTRNGLSASMAATSSARAMDAISHPQTIKRLEELGVKVKNIHGEFKPLPEILDQMNDKFGKMRGPERAEALQELFKDSGGSIQARRFFDAYFKNSKEFNKRVKEMGDSAGVAKDKFNEMSDTPRARLQKLINKFENFKIEIGNHIMPIVLTLVSALTKLLDAFDKLPGPVKRAIAIFGFSAAILTVFAGLLVMISGGIMMIAGAAAVLEISAGALIGIFAAIVGVFALVAFAVYEIYKHWNKIKPFLMKFWKPIQDKAEEFKQWFVNNFGEDFEQIKKQIKAVWEKIKAIFQEAIDKIKEKLNDPQVKAAINSLKEAWGRLVDVFMKHKDEFMIIGKFLGGFFLLTILAVAGVIASLAVAVVEFFTGMLTAVSQFVDGISMIVSGVEGTITGIYNFFADLFTGKWNKLWTDAKQIFFSIWETIKGLFWAAVGGIVTPVQTLVNSVIAFFTTLYDVLVGHSIVPDLIKAVIRWFGKLLGAPITSTNTLVNIVTTLFGAMSGGGLGAVISLVTGTRSNFASLPNKVSNALSDLPSKVAAKFNAVKGIISSILSSVISLGFAKGAAIVRAIANGLRSALATVKSAADDIAAAIARKIPGSPVKEGPLKVLNNGRAGRTIAEMIADGMRDGIPLIKSASDALALAIDVTSGYKGSKSKQRKQALKDAIDLRKQLLEESKRYNESIRDNIKSFGSLSSIEAPTDVFGNAMPMTTQTIVSGLQQKLSAIKTFGTNLKKMKEMGYNSWIIDQVAQMGPEAGAEVAAALIAAMPNDVSQINSLVGEIDSNAKEIGAFAADSMYGAGIATVEGLIAGLESKDKKIRDAAIKIAKQIVDAIKSELGIASPSKVALSLGSNFGSSMAAAIEAEEAAIRNAAAILGSAAQDELTGKPFIVPSGSIYQSGHQQQNNNQGTTQIINNDIDVHTNEIDPKATSAELGFALAERFRL